MSCDMRYWYIIWKINTRNGVEFEKHPLHTMSSGLGISCKVFFLKNIFSGDLHFFRCDIPKYWLLRLLEKVQFKRCLLVYWLRCDKLVWIGSIKWIAWQRGLPGGLAVEGSYVWCLAIVAKFKGLGGANRWEGVRF